MNKHFYHLQECFGCYWLFEWGGENLFAAAVAFVKYFLCLFPHSLAFNGITTEGGKSLAEAMKHNNTVNIFW